MTYTRALLADRGLEAAIEAQARKAAVPTTVAVEDIGRYPQEVESAVYFSVLEAMNNVARYAEADATAVTIAQRNGSVEFAVRDDGHGFDDAATGYGTGLQGIVDRLDAIGGSVTIDSAPRRRHHRSRIGADRGTLTSAGLRRGPGILEAVGAEHRLGDVRGRPTLRRSRRVLLFFVG